MANTNTEVQKGQGTNKGGGAGQQQAITPQREEGRLGGSPFSLMRRFSEDVDRLFDSFLGGGDLGFPGFGGFEQGQALWSPRIDLEQRDDALVLHADLPGVKQDDIQLNLENDILTVSGERKEERKEKKGRTYHSERSYGAFSRSIRLPEGVDADQVKASFKDGVLDVEVPLPKQARSGARRIAIGSGGKEPGGKMMQ